MHTDDSLYHAIIAAHHNRDPKAARRLGLRVSGRDLHRASAPPSISGPGSQARLGIVSPMALAIPALFSRSFAALASVALAVVRPFPFLRVRSLAPCCAADCG